jgi:hypothetical protein
MLNTFSFLGLTALSALTYTEKVLRVDAPHLRETPFIAL